MGKVISIIKNTVQKIRSKLLILSSSTAIRCDIVWWRVYHYFRFAGFPENVDWNATTRIEIAGYLYPTRLCRFVYFDADHLDDLFMCHSDRSKRLHEQLERLAFYQVNIWNVIHDDDREIRLASDGAQAGEFRARQADKHVS